MDPFLFGRFEFQPDNRQLIADGKQMTVGARAFDVLLALIERRDRVVGKEELMQAAWPGLVVEDNNLAVQISSLRKLLGTQAIVTVPGRGYRFTAPVRSLALSVVKPLDDSLLQAEGVWRAEARSALAKPTGNLGTASHTLYGRDTDARSLGEACRSNRLVTLCGAGGIGKTCLAGLVARTLAPAYQHGGWVVELASVREPSQVVPAVAECLAITMPGKAPACDELAGALRQRELLLVLDNCEYQIGAVASLAQSIARQAPGVHILATSQEPLRVAGELVHRLRPLAVPSPEDMDRAGSFGSVELFIERVRDRAGDFQPSRADMLHIVEICRRLDGIALAIELAAARVPLLGVAGVCARLGERLRLLTVGNRVAPDRHQTLRAALTWSHQLLAPATQVMLRRLGVFEGGFSLEGAQRVTWTTEGAETDVIEHLGLLVDRSLLSIELGTRPRYRMLESMRIFALEELAAAGETDETSRRHAHALTEICTLAVKQRDSAWLWAEMSNARAALGWALATPGEETVAVTLATQTAVLLATAGPVPEAVNNLLRVEHLIDDGTPPALAARYWQWLGRLGIEGRLPSSRCIEALQRAIAMFEASHEDRHVHACHRMIAEAFMRTGDLSSAQAQLALAEALETNSASTSAADRMRRWRIAGLLADAAGDQAGALQLAQSALAIAESRQIHRYRLMLVADIAWFQLRMGQPDAAAARLHALLELIEPSPREGLTRAYALTGLTASLLAAGRLSEARTSAPHTIDALRRSGTLLARGDIFAWLAAASGHPEVAAQVLGATDRFHERGETRRDWVSLRARVETQRHLGTAFIVSEAEFWTRQGSHLEDGAVADLLRTALADSQAKGDAPVSWEI